MRSAFALICLTSLPLVACNDDGGSGSGGDGGGTGGSCDAIPSCYSDAVADLRTCVSSAALTLGTVTESSGVIQGLTCSAGDMQVQLSDFSSSATGIVPVPSTLTILQGGTECAEIGSGEGTISAGGQMQHYEASILRRPGADEVQLLRYDDGHYEVQCGVGANANTEISADTQAACPEGLLFHGVTRDDSVTTLDVVLTDASGSDHALFTCSQ